MIHNKSRKAIPPRTHLLIAALLTCASVATLTPAAANPNETSDTYLFVTFELVDVRTKSPLNGALRATFADAAAEATVSARAGDAIQASIPLPMRSAEGGNWSIELTTLGGASLLQVDGVLTGQSIQILGSRVDTNAIELPPDTTSLRVIKGHVSAVVALVGKLTQDNCCTATLGIDGDADGNISAQETLTNTSLGRDVRVELTLERAAPSVPYVFTIKDAQDRVVARASGTYSFTNLNGVSATGEFDPTVVEFVTGSVQREPHLVQHDIGSSILLQTVAGSARQEDGPRVFFTMGTPTAHADAGEGTTGDAPLEPAAQAAANEAQPNGSATLFASVVELFTGRVFLAIVLGAFAAAVLAFIARRLMERTS